jgi:hypothetical protein
MVDFLGGLNPDGLKSLTWVVAGVAAALLVAWRWRRVDLAALGGSLIFAVASFAAGVYVLFHLGDGRWGGDAHERLVAPSLAGTPVVGQFLKPVDGLLSGLADGVNEFNDVQAALPVAGGFLAAAGWAFALAVPLSILSLVVGFFLARYRKAEFVRVARQVEDLSAEVAGLRQLVGSPSRM